MVNLNDVSIVLDTYKGRDKVLKTLCYGTRLISTIRTEDELSSRLRKFASKLSDTRAVLRLLDDVSTIHYALEYGIGKKEPNKYMAFLGIMANLADLIYCPVDKICWLSSSKLIKIQNPGIYETTNTVCWALSTYFSLLRSLWILKLLHEKKTCMAQNQDTLEYSNLRKRQRNEILTCVKLLLDFVHAVQSLPPGFLWSSKLKAWHVGLIGTASGLVSLYQMLTKK